MCELKEEKKAEREKKILLRKPCILILRNRFSIFS